MSGGPPHHPHSRQAPPSNTAWNHLQVPNYFPTRQPQHAHMSNEHSLLHQPTWHTPTTEPMKTMPHSHIFSLEQMLSERQYPRHAPGVDLSVTRNGSQNGEILNSPISLSVRDTNKINSLPVSALDIQPVDVGPAAIKPVSPGLKSISPGLSAADSKKRSSKRVDSILERLNPNLEKPNETEKDSEAEKPTNRSVIVQAASSQDENSNSSSTLNVPTPTNVRDDEVVSPYSNEDSLDSNKSRRKRKPSKTMRVPKEEEKTVVPDQSTNTVEVKKDDSKTNEAVSEEKKMPERRRSSDDAVEEVPSKTRRKASSESETIDNIAAMVQESLKSKPVESTNTVGEEKQDSKAISVSVIKTKDNLQETLTSETSDLSNSSNNVSTTAQKKATNTQFVEVENKLEEMFAGIEDTSDPLKVDNEAKVEDLSKLEDNPASTSQDNVTSTSNDLTVLKKSPKKRKRKQRRTQSRRNSDISTESTPKKKGKKIGKIALKTSKLKKNSKIETMKDVYAYDSGSNASSSKSRGPFIQIRGPRDSPLSVSVINTPTNDDDPDKKTHKSKKFHDDSEYRHKVRTKGLHSSTLSNQYDAQTKDASWICAFCKRGPHATEVSGPTLSVNAPAPGDLFGPYFITTNSPEFERRLDDPYDKQFKSKKVTRTLDSNAANVKITGKKKRKYSMDLKEDEIYLGITDTGSGTYEIWAHEDCIVWSAGTYLVGPKIVGLEEAVWTSCNVVCIKCHIRGANICCLKRGCVRVAHMCCARLTNWQFDEENYKTYCPEHRVL